MGSVFCSRERLERYKSETKYPENAEIISGWLETVDES